MKFFRQIKPRLHFVVTFATMFSASNVAADDCSFSSFKSLNYCRVAVHCGFATCPVSSTQLRLKLSLNKSRYRVGESIRARVEIYNIGKNRVILPTVMMPQDYWLRFVVKREGKVMKYTGPQLDLNGVDKTFRLRSDYSWGRVFTIASLFDFKKPGRYTVQCFYERTERSNKAAWRGELQSKIVPLQIVQRK